MKQTFKTISSVMVIFALLLTTLSGPTAIAFSTTDFGSSLDFGDSLFSSGSGSGSSASSDSGSGSIFDDDASVSSESSESSSSTYTTCKLTANLYTIYAGDSVTLSWNTSGYDTLTLNGETLAGNSGSKLFTNVQVNTTYTLEAVTASGSKCVQNVHITCLPPITPKECELTVQKTVDTNTAIPGQELTYTITVKNVGDADCTGDGVRIEDVVDPNLTYLSHQLSSNFSAGYGSKPVYTAGDRTLHFNGNVLEPNESGTITWKGKVATPNQCGDFEVKNQAKATAKELNDFSTWVYSQTVKTQVDYDCSTPDPCELVVTKAVDKATGKPGDVLTYTIIVKNIGEEDCSGSGVLIEDKLDANIMYLSNTVSSNLAAGYLNIPVYTNNDHTLHFNGFVLEPNELGTITWKGKVKTPAQCGDFEVKNQAKATAAELNNFQTWAYSQTVKTFIDNDCVVPTPPVCTLTPATQMIPYGGTADLTWTTDHADTVTLTSFGTVDLDGSTTTGALFTNTNYVLTATGDDGTVTCHAVVKVSEQELPPTCDLFTATPGTILVGNSSTLNWETSNATEVFLNNGIGAVAVDGSIEVTPLASLTYTLTVNGVNNQSVSCEVPVTVSEHPVPTCDLFTATPNIIVVGNSSTLNWETTNATAVSINNGIGNVAVDGSVVVSPLANTVYTLTATGVSSSTSCEVPVTVSADPVPVCESFTATPNSLPVGGGSVTLNWNVLNGTTATITPTIGAVAQSGSKSTTVTNDTTFTLTAEDDNGDVVSCTAPVTVADPEPDPFTCENNVSFTVSDDSIRRGDDTTLTWSTTDVDTVSISQINATALSGSERVSPSSDTTYTLTATQGNKQVLCPLTVDVTTGGGGGGSSSPRCELEISDKKIKLGEEITLTWDTSRATEVTITDDRGREIVTTEDKLAREKIDLYDGSIKLRPTRDTEYTLLAERGSRDRECTVEVEVEDSVTVIENRSQQPLVSGISLTQVPYTGFEAGPVLTVLFYLLLVAWSLYITYLIVLRNKMALEGVDTDDIVPEIPESVRLMQQAERIRPEVFTQATVAPTETHSTTPMNLPTATVQVGYGDDAVIETRPQSQHVTEIVATELENRAHQQHALLSSDAIRYFLSSTEGDLERNELLDAVIADAKKTYPLEDGWSVINEARMRNLCDACLVENQPSNKAPYMPAVVPEGTGSLAEAIVTGNVIAAYEMIGNRPMFSLADAAADLDALVRARKGETVQVSDMLRKETEQLSEDQLKNMIGALTGAIDGTYNDEASAVKVAIMKAIKEIA